ncbi:MAG: hypothetical protein LBQ45_00765 [Mycoplasmataceae bacterium]|nr:hypothetical protein [Mycoplasmataceae bacterium]
MGKKYFGQYAKFFTDGGSVPFSQSDFVKNFDVTLENLKKDKDVTALIAHFANK